MVPAKAALMETNGSHWTVAAVMAFWATLGVAILAGVKKLLSRLWVSRDAVQQEYIDGLKADVRDVRDAVALLASHQEAQDMRLRYLENAVLSRDGR